MTDVIKKIFILFLSVSLVTIVVIFSILWTFSNNIPDYKFLKNYKPPVSSKMYSGDGDLVADFSVIFSLIIWGLDSAFSRIIKEFFNLIG